MSRIVEGIKELLKGKDDDDREYRYRRTERGSLGSNRYNEYPMNASPKGRSGYPTEGRSSYSTQGRTAYPTEGRSAYPTEGQTAYPTEGRSAYPTEGQSAYPTKGRSAYPTEGQSAYPTEGRSAYPTEGQGAYPTSGRSAYPTEGRSAYPTDGRNNIPIDRRSNIPIDGRSGISIDGQSGIPIDGQSAYPSDGRSGIPIEGRSGYLVDGRSNYPVTMSSDGRSSNVANSIPVGRSPYSTNERTNYPVDERSGYSSERHSGYPTEGRSGYLAEGRSGYPTEGRSGYPTEGRSGYPIESRSDYPTEGHTSYSTEGRSGYPASTVADGYSDYPTNSTPEIQSTYPIKNRSGNPVSVTTDGRSGYPVSATIDGYPTNVSASGYQGPSRRQMVDDDYSQYSYDSRNEVGGEFDRPYVASSRETKYNQAYGIQNASPRGGANYRTSPRIEIPPRGEYAPSSTPNSRKVNSPSGYYETVAKTGILEPPPESSSRGSPSGRPTLVRMPSFASGKVMQYDGIGPRGQDYEAKDYNGFRRMPSFGKSRHHEAEYISGYDERLEPRVSSYGEFTTPIRRMPSFNRSRYHDAEYMAADYDRDYTPRSFYDNGSSYTSSYNDRPSLLSQVSFSKIPIENPNYVKQIMN